MRVAQMGLGPIGRSTAALLLNARDVKLVGAADPAAGLAGRDLGELLGTPATGLEVRDSIESVLDEAAPELVVHTTGSFLEDTAPELKALARRGLHVVSTCEELAYPFYRHPALADELDGVARQGGAVLLGTGINPGFLMDKLVVTLTAACASVHTVRVTRIVDAGTRRESFQRKVGAGLAPDEFERRKAGGRMGHIGLAESAHMVGDALGIGSDRSLRRKLRSVVARERQKTGCLVVEPGQVAGIHETATLSAGGEDRIHMDLQMYVGAPDPRDAVSVEGSPSLEFEATAGVPGDEGTANVVLSCVALAGSLKHGLRTMLDVPLLPPWGRSRT